MRVVSGLGFHALDDVVRVIGEEVFERTGRKYSHYLRGTVSGQDGQDEIPCLVWIIIDQVANAVEGPEKLVVFGRVVLCLLQSDPSGD